MRGKCVGRIVQASSVLDLSCRDHRVGTILEICALTRAVDPDAAARTITADGSVGDVGEASLFDWHHGMFEGVQRKDDDGPTVMGAATVIPVRAVGIQRLYCIIPVTTSINLNPVTADTKSTLNRQTRSQIVVKQTSRSERTHIRLRRLTALPRLSHHSSTVRNMKYMYV